MRLTLSQWGLRVPTTQRLGRTTGRYRALAKSEPTEEKQTDSKHKIRILRIADHSADILRTTKVALDALLPNGADPASTMKEANEEVNAVFE
jgi:hypothetical protein